MRYPKLKFKISPNKDLSTVIAFSKDAYYDNGRNLSWAVFKKYPLIKRYFDTKDFYKLKNKKALKDFIYKVYKKENNIIKAGMVENQRAWSNISSHYFILITKLFRNRQWPKGKYISYATIWTMYPRFLNDKTFQIPYKHRYSGYVKVIIAHELLHFMFFDYFYYRYPKYKNPKYNFYVWNVSEIFNNLIQNSPEWLKIFKYKSIGYPEHKIIVSKLSKKIYKNNDFDLDKIIKLIINALD